jgi:3D (Asp-Asp-Asp) domain-containing protein
MLISDSVWRKALVTLVAIGGFLALYEVTMLDSRYAAQQAVQREATALPSPGAHLAFTATAYCKGTMTASGVTPRNGVAASDPSLLPVGSVIQIASDRPEDDGIYTIMDTGPSVRGRHVDIYMWSCTEALRFGRRPVHITVLRLGWSPRATAPTLLDVLLRGSEATPSAPIASSPKAAEQQSQ